MTLILLLVGGEKELPDFKDQVEACRAAGPVKVFSANKAVDAATQLNVRPFLIMGKGAWT
jgi:hypothetical protein